MKRTYLLLAFVIIGAITILSTTDVHSHKAFAPPGYCGDPTGYPPYVTCASAGCHGGTTQAITLNNLSVKIGTDSTSLAPLDNTFRYIPGQTYYIDFKVLAPGYVWGFEMTTLNPGTSMAGMFDTISGLGLHVKVNTILAPQYPVYISHNGAAPTVNSWLFTWTAPTTDSAVTFYYAFNASDSADFTANGFAGVADSNIFADTVIVLASSAGIANVSNSISGLQIYPNPIDGAFSLSFDVLKAGNASAMLYSVDGKLCRQLFNESLGSGAFNRNYNIASLAPGIYLVKLNVGGATITKKIVKE